MMLDNVLLYLSSAMAQVWAAVLVYQLLKVQDAIKENEATLFRYWRLGREWLVKVIPYMLNSGSPGFIDSNNSYGVLREDLQLALASRESFSRVAKAVKEHQLIRLGANTVTAGPERGLRLSSEEVQRLFDSVADKIRTTEMTIDKLRREQAYLWPLIGILGNILVLSSLPVLDHWGRAVKLALNGVLGFGNLGLLLWTLFCRNREHK